MIKRTEKDGIVTLEGPMMHVGTPNLNGVTFTTESAMEVVNQLTAYHTDKKSIFCFVGIPQSFTSPPLDDITAELKSLHFKEAENKLYASLTLLGTDKGKHLDKMLSSFPEGEFSIVGNYLVDDSVKEDKVIRSASLESVSIIPTKDRA